MENSINELVIWYQKNKRELPWRKDQDPYHVWVSEIMLQQTRIEMVIDYYHRFMKELPTIRDLAECNSDQLHKLWEGLGYYSRVRNLQKAALIIMNDFAGIFPINYQDILSLPGIGEYTASAIASICFNQKEATVDGNVLRVYMRIYNCYDNIDEARVRKRIRDELMNIIPEKSGDFNQAMMELGETVCIPNGIPKCEICPLKNCCQAYQKNTYQLLPVRNSKKLQKEELYTVLIFYYQDLVWLSKRIKPGLLHNLWQFPNISNHLTKKQLHKYLTSKNIPFSNILSSISYTHIFTHKRWNMISYFIKLNKKIYIDDTVIVNIEELNSNFAIPTAFQPFKKEIEKLIQTKKDRK